MRHYSLAGILTSNKSFRS